MATDWRDRITADPAILVGKPVVRGTRLAVEFVLDIIAGGWSFDEVLANYPGLTVEDIRACVVVMECPGEPGSGHPRARSRRSRGSP